ncbi:hypothetical protein F4805DRAFT_438369 [Annulohypoxylon moriforme]|nr:hypothetical protein F4805DRAFT_438369 [Annulohypoxylon moriforme]
MLSTLISAINSFLLRDNMEPREGFPFFNDLPKELRILIWKYYFESHRLHVVHPAPECEDVNPAKKVLSYSCTVIDPATNVIIENARPPSPLINHEAHEVFQRCKRTWTPITFSNDFARSMTSSRGRLPPQFAKLASNHVEQIRDERPIYIDFSRDMLYICAMHTEQAFWLLRSTAWRNEVRRLAVLVPHTGFAGAIPFGPSAPVREVLDYMQGLEELFIVLIPQAGKADIIHSPNTSEAIARLRRDINGFVPYLDYVKEAGLASNHTLYTRTSMLIRKAMTGAPREIKIERVVDVDYVTSPFGYYERKPRLPVETTTST